MNSRIASGGATALLAIAIVVGAGGGAQAAPAPVDTHGSDVTVSVPAATPAPSTSAPPVMPPSTGGTGGAGGAGTSGGSGGGRAVGGAGTAPAAETAESGSSACVPKEPAVPTAPATETAGEASVDKEVYAAGETVTAIAAGFEPHEQVQLVLFSEPALVGTFAADDTGAVTAQFAIAAETLAGTHTVQFTGWCGSVSGVEILVGTTNDSASAGPQGVPPWLWWAGGLLGLALLILAAWWAIRVMRVPAPAEAVPA
jgi:hypothetical protein